MFCTSHHGNLSKDCAMGRKCGTYVGKKEMHTEFRWGNLKERHRPVDYARTRIKKKKWKGGDWNDLAQDRDK